MTFRLLYKCSQSLGPALLTPASPGRRISIGSWAFRKAKESSRVSQGMSSCWFGAFRGQFAITIVIYMHQKIEFCFQLFHELCTWATLQTSSSLNVLNAFYLKKIKKHTLYARVYKAYLYNMKNNNTTSGCLLPGPGNNVFLKPRSFQCVFQIEFPSLPLEVTTIWILC